MLLGRDSDVASFRRPGAGLFGPEFAKRKKTSKAWRPARIVNRTSALRLIALAALFLPLATPAAQVRSNPAGLGENWTYEGVAFNAFRSPSPSVATEPVYRYHDGAGGYLFAASTAGVTAAQNDNHDSDGVAFYAPSKGGRSVFRFRDRATGRALLTLNEKEGVVAGLEADGVAFLAYPVAGAPSSSIPVWRYRNTRTGAYLYTASSENPYSVGAFYFSTFAPSGKSIIAGAAAIYGRRNDWWGGVEDFYGRQPNVKMDTRGWVGDWSYLKPQIGYYDESQTATLERQINQAADAGLSFFSFYWYWSNAAQDSRLPEALTSFLAARNVARLKFNLTLYAHPWDDDMAISPSNSGRVIDKLVGLFSRPQYLRLPDGRPVFAIGDDRNFRDEHGDKCADEACITRALNSFLRILNERSVAVVGAKPYVQISIGVPGWDRIDEIDGLTCTVPPIELKAGTPYPSFDEQQIAALAHNHKTLSPCMLENFDERPRQDILIKDRGAIRFLVGKTEAKFRANLTAVRQFSDSQYEATKDPAAHVVYLYAWNEWHEGGILEPNVATGAADLNVVTEAFHLPRSSSPCLEQGKCDFR